MNNKIEIPFRQSIWWKVTLILSISILLMIPVSMVEDVIHERHHYSVEAKQEVSEKWSKSQTVGAVLLTIPIVQERSRQNKDGKTIISFHKSHLHILPDELHINAVTENMIRNRGLYRIPLYKTQLELTGFFSKVNQIADNLEKTEIKWDQAELNLGVDDVRGLKQVRVEWNGKELEKNVGSMASKIATNAITSQIPDTKSFRQTGKGRYKFTLELRGSETLNFLPFGDDTQVKLASNWGDPSFFGAFLPDSREIQPEAFQSQWNILKINRNLPKHFIGCTLGQEQLHKVRFGVEFMLPLETYQLNTRSVKYSFLFVAMTFTTLFFIEILFGLKFHPMHFTMTGAGLCLFYLLLLSISEHLGFTNAYLIASAATILSITLYIFGVTGQKKGACILFAQLAVLYGFLFTLLRQEDYALVTGSAGLWMVLALLMYLTRGIDWFNVDSLTGKKEALT